MRRHLCLVVAALVAVATLSSCDWEQPGFGPARTGFNSGETKVGVDNVADLEQLWSSPVDPVAADAQVLESRGRVFVTAVGDTIPEGSTVSAYRADTGRFLWSKRFTGDPDLGVPGPTLTITVTGGSLIVARSFGTSPGELTALDVATGATRWTSLNNFLVIDPVVSGGIIYAAYGELAGGVQVGFAAVDSTNGQLLFRSQNPVSQAPHVSVAGPLAFMTLGTNVEAYDATGQQGCDPTTHICTPQWTGDLGTTAGTPSVAGGVVYVGGGDGTLRAYAAGGCGQATCQPLWAAAGAGGAITSSPAVADGVVYTLSATNLLAAFAAGGCGAATCDPLWTGGTVGLTRAAPAVGNGVVYVPGGDDTIQGFAADGCGAATCAPLWTAPLGAASDGSPIVARGRVYTGAAGSVKAFALPPA